LLDILVRNGWLADGTGNPLRPADVAIEGDRIVDVGRMPGARARRVIDATGKIVCPGFVDSHSHSDSTILANPTAQSTIRQGTTTEIVGNCGHSPAPLPEGAGAWRTFREYLDAVDRTRITPNMGWFVGHNSVRVAAGLSGVQYTEGQMGAMESLVREAMEAGALGLSTGLEFDPGRRASTEEVVRLAQIVGEYDGYYVSHIRNRAKAIQAAIEEFLDIVRRSGTHGQVSHLNVRYHTGAAPDAWQRAIDTVVQAREEGLDVAADCTPFEDGGGGPAAILPDWVTVDGPERAAERLEDPEVRAQVRQDSDRYWAFIYRGDFDRVRISRSEAHPEIMGKNLVQIGEMWDEHPWDVLFDLLVAAYRGEDKVSYVGHLFRYDDVRQQVQHPLINLAVDARTVSLEGPLRNSYMHPLPFAGMVHYLTYWVREKGVLRLEEAIRKMTSMPALRFGLKGRGMVHAGSYADVVVFDYEELDDVSTIEQPLAYCKGVEHVLVNGVPVVAGAEHTGARPGRTLTYS
jgi:N-acyl-D-amino-acid deacylase